MQITKPFVFGVPVDQTHFIGRSKEINTLTANLTHGIHTVLISPRKWGKTSLVRHVTNGPSFDGLKVVHIDIFACRDEYDFYNKFATELLRQTENRFEMWMQLAGDFLTRLVPKVSFSPTPDVGMTVSLGITPATHRPEEILNLPQVLAERLGKHIVVCIDEFQQIGEFPDTLSVQRKMRTVWQNQKDITYCMFGSKMHMMMNLFQKRSYPFYKFGDNVQMPVIPTAEWVPYICNRFKDTGRTISEGLAAEICTKVANCSSYVQQLAWHVLLNTEKEADKRILDLSLSELIQGNSSLFIEQTGSLTLYQMNFLRALISGVHTDFGIESIRTKYGLGSYSNIKRIQTALIDKEIIEISGKTVTIADPLMKLWLKDNI